MRVASCWWTTNIFGPPRAAPPTAGIDPEADGSTVLAIGSGVDPPVRLARYSSRPPTDGSGFFGSLTTALQLSHASSFDRHCHDFVRPRLHPDEALHHQRIGGRH